MVSEDFHSARFKGNAGINATAIWVRTARTIALAGDTADKVCRARTLELRRKGWFHGHTNDTKGLLLEMQNGESAILGLAAGSGQLPLWSVPKHGSPKGLVFFTKGEGGDLAQSAVYLLASDGCQVRLIMKNTVKENVQPRGDENATVGMVLCGNPCEW